MNYSEQLAYIVPTQTEALARHRLPNGETVWVRKASKHNAMWRYCLLGAMVKPLKLGVLKPVPSVGGMAAIHTEAQRLQALAMAGVRVPTLLAVQENALMMSRLSGMSLEVRVEREAAKKRIHAWRLGIRAIAAVHQQNQYLSQGFARNMLISGNKIGFIDFEDDPAGVLTLAECQCRDWLCYLHSTALMLQKQGLLPQALPFWQAQLHEQSVDIQDLLYQTVRPLYGLRRLQHPRWGRDALRLSAVMAFFDGKRISGCLKR